MLLNNVFLCSVYGIYLYTLADLLSKRAIPESSSIAAWRHSLGWSDLKVLSYYILCPCTSFKLDYTRNAVASLVLEGNALFMHGPLYEKIQFICLVYSAPYSNAILLRCASMVNLTLSSPKYSNRIRPAAICLIQYTWGPSLGHYKSGTTRAYPK